MEFIDASEDQGRAACAAEIRKALRRGPDGDLLEKRLTVGRARLRKTDFTDTMRRLADQVVAGMRKCGIVPAPLLKAMARGAHSGVGDCSTAAIRKIHAAGARFETPDAEWLRKVAAPPQSSNSRYDNVLADDGATLGTQRQPVPGAKPSRLGPPHSASMNEGPPPPADSNVDPTVKALKAIHAAGPKHGL